MVSSSPLFFYNQDFRLQQPHQIGDVQHGTIRLYYRIPNHIHTIFRLICRNHHKRLGQLFVGINRRLQKKLNGKGIGCSVWQLKYYEHIIRNEQSYINIAEYIIKNPAKWQEDRFYRG